ncbi:MAG TPA: peptidase [Microcoleaceae cyanobacterium]|jgi:formate hydrogenlyase subunit 3/multisubunit Na+/H+ antiporter MnhD subunit
MKRSFRKYHRALALIVSIPLILTLLTGIATSLIGEWSLSLGLSRSVLLKLHTGEIFHLEKIYPILNGIGLLGMVVTGLSMTNLFNRRPQPNRNS